MELAGDIEVKRNEDREQQHFEGLMTKVDILKEENQRLQTRIANIEDKSRKLESQVCYQEGIVERQSMEIKDQEKLVKEQKDAIDKLLEDQKVKKRWSCGSKLNTNILEKKMEELAGDFRMKMEDHIRILYRRIHVAEELHVESKNNYYNRTQTQEKRVSVTELVKSLEPLNQILSKEHTL